MGDWSVWGIDMSLHIVYTMCNYKPLHEVSEMTRVMYQPTEKQLKKWPAPNGDKPVAIPSDEVIKAEWKKSHNGKLAGWGIGKRDRILSNMTATYEYQLGIWQGRVDAARGLEYSEERNENTYNLGYYRGYTNFDSDWCGWDKATRQRFTEQYVEAQ
jgi:hypothetical protein